MIRLIPSNVSRKLKRVYAVFEYAGDKENIVISQLKRQGGTPGAWFKGLCPSKAAGKWCSHAINSFEGCPDQCQMQGISSSAEVYVTFAKYTQQMSFKTGHERGPDCLLVACSAACAASVSAVAGQCSRGKLSQVHRLPPYNPVEVGKLLRVNIR